MLSRNRLYARSLLPSTILMRYLAQASLGKSPLSIGRRFHFPFPRNAGDNLAVLEIASPSCLSRPAPPPNKSMRTDDPNACLSAILFDSGLRQSQSNPRLLSKASTLGSAPRNLMYWAIMSLLAMDRTCFLKAAANSLLNRLVSLKAWNASASRTAAQI